MKIQIQKERPAVFVEVTQEVILEVCSALNAAGLSICLTSGLSETSQCASICDITIIDELEKIAVSIH